MSSPFRAAVEARDHPALVATLAEDVVFRSPAVFKAYEGRDAVGFVLGGALKVFEDFRYTAELSDGDREVLMFEARVGDRELQGADFLLLDADGRVKELVVMVRPLSGLTALAEAMGRLLAQSGG